jgi:hypothetical protein
MSGMKAVQLLASSCSRGWSAMRSKLVPGCSRADCESRQRARHPLLGARHPQVRIHDARFCVGACMERALRDLLHESRPSNLERAPHHRVPLGLLLLSRQQLNAGQLRAAVEAQRRAGRGRIGEWIQALGFAGEEQVTAALARQWSCPVWRGPLDSRLADTCRLPRTLLRHFAMLPVSFTGPSATLHIAFSEAIDYSVLYAIEQMENCRTAPCFVAPTQLRACLHSLPLPGTDSELVFDRVVDLDECTRIIRSYTARVSAREIRLALCGSLLWVRLLTHRQKHLDLLLGSVHETVDSSMLQSSAVAFAD